MRTRIKVCCISSIDEARMAIGLGADALGLVARMPSGPGPIEDSLIAEIGITIPPPVARFLLTSEQSASNIIDHVTRTKVNCVQIVDELSEGSYDHIRMELPYVSIIQVIHVTGKESIAQAMQVHEKVDAILLDSGIPTSTIKILGGTGKTHNWEISRQIVESVGVPVFLAGGLNASNVGEAIGKVRPFGVDVCSGVRTEGRLDPVKLADFVSAVNR
jgi:phosphoribosylanthranilate isomerase